MILRRSLLALGLAGAAVVGGPGGTALGQERSFGPSGSGYFSLPSISGDITDASLWSPSLPSFGTDQNGRWNINGTTVYSVDRGTTTVVGDRGLVIGSNASGNSQGHLTISGGTLLVKNLGGSAALVGAPGPNASGSSSLTLSGGILTVDHHLSISSRGNNTASAFVDISNGSVLTARDLTFGALGAGTGNGVIAETQKGDLNVLTGGTVVIERIFEASNMRADILLNGGTIRSSTDPLAGHWISGFVGAGGTTTASGLAITLGTNGGTLHSGGFNDRIVSTNIVGAGAMTVTGGGSIDFRGANTYTGGTTVAAGTTLKVGNTTAIGTGSLNLLGTLDATAAGVTVGNGTDALETLTLTGNILGNATLNGVELSGFGVGTGTDVSGNLSLAGLSKINWDFDTTASEFNFLDIGGDFSFASGTIFDIGNASLQPGFFAMGGFGGTISDLSNVTLAGDFASQYTLTTSGTEFGITAVPEPSSMALLGLVGTAVAVRRRMKKAKA